jgi:hypothetical protein
MGGLTWRSGTWKGAYRKAGSRHDQGLTRATIKGLLVPRSRAYACLDQGLTRASIKGLRVPRSRAYACRDQGLTRATIRGLRVARSRAYAWHDQGLTRATIKGLRAPRSRAYARLDQGLDRASILSRNCRYGCWRRRRSVKPRGLTDTPAAAEEDGPGSRAQDSAIPRTRRKMNGCRR